MITINKTKNPDYKDLDLDFFVNPGTKDIAKKTGEESIKNSIYQLVMTNFWERPFRSYIGSNVQKLLFENATNLTQTYLENAVTEVINNFEPRVTLLGVVAQVSNDNNSFIVGLKYMINNRLEPTIQSIFLQRIR